MIPNRWSIYAYDWDVHQEIAPLVRGAESAADLLKPDLADGHAFVLSAPPDSSMPYLAVGVLIARCAVGEPVRLGPDVPGMLRQLRRTPGGDDLAEFLAELLYGARHVEDWFRAPEAPMGLCTPAHALTLRRAADRFRRGLGVSGKTVPRRLLPSMARLFAPSESGAESLDEFLALLDDAVDSGLGLAALGEGE